MEEWSKVIAMTWRRDELLYDIANNCYVEGDVMKTDDDHDRHQVQDVTQLGNIDRVQRVMDLAWAVCVEALHPYSRRPVEHRMVQDDKLHYYDCYYMEMLVPDNFSRTTMTLITRLIHEFIVCKACYDWLLLTYPDKAAMWNTRAEDAMEKLKDTKNRNEGSDRRKLSPF